MWKMHDFTGPNRVKTVIEIAGYHRSIGPQLWHRVGAMATQNVEDLYAACPAPDHMLHERFRGQMAIEFSFYFHADGLFRATSSWLFVATDKGVPVGFALCTPHTDHPSHCTLKYAVVIPSHRRQGIFKRLLATIEMGFEAVALSCKPALVNLYEKSGYSFIGQDGPYILMSNGLVMGEPVKIQQDRIQADNIWKMSYEQIASRYGYDQTNQAIDLWGQRLAKETQNTRNYVDAYLAKRFPRTGTGR